MIPQKQVSAYRLALRNVVHTAFLALSMNSIIHVFFTKAYREGQSGKETERNSFPQEIEVAGGSPEGAEIPALSLFSPLWAFFGYFLSQQKVTTSPPQRRREQQAKSCLLFKSIMIIMEKRHDFSAIEVHPLLFLRHRLIFPRRHPGILLEYLTEIAFVRIPARRADFAQRLRFFAGEHHLRLLHPRPGQEGRKVLPRFFVEQPAELRRRQPQRTAQIRL